MKLHNLYVDLIKVHSYRFGLYKPALTLELRPGLVRYWNNLGVWQPIIQLDNADEVKKKGLKIPKEDLVPHEFDPETD
ncbi:hypothetical protein BCR34DRAFT_489888 [Clohesyomyces aquaticus]|uniref:Uncharacterized protein n=1 Tax=Clohesyomyces aquaticus TaxID=1231657 RepID=A0A1Y1Z933_9PLEO|nr:hypothetical protein BCR34DRAFT_489888 [Clohesyomyces aquaticus]